jgi:hypothetical protein
VVGGEERALRVRHLVEQIELRVELLEETLDDRGSDERVL